MFERYTEQARRALFFARWNVSAMGGAELESMHLLAGLLKQAKGLTGELFDAHGITAEEVRRALEASHPDGPRLSTAAEIPFAEDTRQILDFAAHEADRLLSDAIGTEHLLVGLLRMSSTDAARLLAGKGLDPQAVREAIRRRAGS